MEEKKGLGMLFDLSFSEFVTTRVIKVVFAIFIVLSAIGAIGIVVSAFSASIWAGLLFLILSPVIFLIYVLFARIWCEMIVVIFRIAENTAGMAAPQKAEVHVEKPGAEK